MKKLATIVMLAVAMVAGGASADAKTVAKKSKARTTQTARKSSKSAGTVATVSRGGEKLVLTSGGKVNLYLGSDLIPDRGGKYVQQNGAYILNWGDGNYGDNHIGVIEGNTMYEVVPSYYQYDDFWSYLWDNVSGNLNAAVTVNPNNRTVTLKTTNGTKTVRLDEVNSYHATK